ncbi:hypothetical protein BDZ89DRAFT_309066 [Hymenopellis radicata]|nr:hypothetical protein BDZ89DRAFT_309066 [Hymenopellis radicata]
MINISLALVPGRIPLGAIYRSRGGYYDSDDIFHAAFWRHYAPQDDIDLDTEHCKAYLQRCLGVIVAWYAVLLEAGERDQAVGDEHVPFGKHVLVELLLRTLDNISSVFGLDRPDIGLHVDLGGLSSPTTSISVENPPPHLPDYSHPLTSTPFQCLPPELHLYIFSFTNSGSLFDLVKVCKWLRSICTPLLYADPLGAAHHNFLQKRKKRSSRRFNQDFTTYLLGYLPRFNSFMDSRSDLCGHLRVFHVPLVDIIHVDGPDVTFDVPSWWSLARRVADITLYAPLSFFAEMELGAFADVMRRAASIVASHFPGAPSVTIDESWRGKSPNTSLITKPENPASCISWEKLSKLKFVIRCKSDNFAMCSMISGSASTLRNLTIHTRCELDVGAFPICPNVVNLDICLTLLAGAMEDFLGRFPETCSLSLSHWMRPAANNLAPIDFSITSPRLQHLLVQGYPIGGIPRSLETLSFEASEHWHYCNVTVKGVEAIFLRNIGNPVSLFVKFAGEICTGVRSLEVTGISYQLSDNQLVRLQYFCASPRLNFCSARLL